MHSIVSYIPNAFLKKFVGSITYLEGLGTGIALQRVYQTIVINLGDNFFKADLYTGEPPKENTSLIWINGMHEHPFALDNFGKPRMYVIGVLPGMLTHFSSLPVADTNEKALSAEHWGQPELFDLREQLLKCDDIQAGFKLIENYFTAKLENANSSGSHEIGYLSKAFSDKTVSEMCDDLGYTRKKLRSDAIHHFGAPVKFMQGIIRFDIHLAAIAREPQQLLSSLHTFYDQAHFINDFKARTGFTPRQYRALCQQFPQIRFTPNFIPLSEETFLQFIANSPA